MTFVIEKDVPIPQPRIPRLPLDEMQVGESISVPVADGKDENTVRVRLYRYRKKNPHKKFTMRKLSEREFRIYRIAADADNE